jgi:hypothetical protein
LETYCLENFENGGCLFATCVPVFEQFCLDNGGDPQPFHPDQLKYRLVNVKMKVLHDYFFEQIATNGDQVNTTQVFAYELFNQEKEINLIGDAVELQNNQNSFGEYIPGQMFLGYEFITPDNPVVHEVIGNNIFANGQEILIGGTFPATAPSFHSLTIQAQEQIHVIPGARISPQGMSPSAKTHLRIKKDFYDTPVFEYADNDAVGAFCNNSNAYQANTPSAALRQRIEDAIAAQEPDALGKANAAPASNITLYPNPARSELTIKTIGTGLDQLTIFDASSRPVMQASPGGQMLHRMDISSLAPGVYILQAACGEEVLTEKLVVAK